MRTHVIAVLALAALCGGWIALQEWIRRVDRSLPGIRRKCGACDGSCEDRHERSALDSARPAV